MVWCDNECTQATKKQKLAFCELKSKFNLENFIRRKKKSWKNGCTSINANTNISTVWKRDKACKNTLTRKIKARISTEKTKNHILF